MEEISSRGTANKSCSTNASRSAGAGVSSTVALFTIAGGLRGSSGVHAHLFVDAIGDVKWCDVVSHATRGIDDVRRWRWLALKR
jgi:hypothetical protein